MILLKSSANAISITDAKRNTNQMQTSILMLLQLLMLTLIPMIMLMVNLILIIMTLLPPKQVPRYMCVNPLTENYSKYPPGPDPTKYFQ